jgi:microcystin-dependent protein
MSTASIPFKLTSVGIDEAFYKDTLTLNLNITHVQIGDGNRTPTGTEVALVSPRESAAINNSYNISVDQHRIGAYIAASLLATYNVSEIGLWSGAPGGVGSVLVLYWSQATGNVAVKSNGVDFNFENDLFFGGVVPANITIVADAGGTALAMIAAHDTNIAAHLGRLVPVSTIIYVPLSSAPTGFLKANGALISRSSYANLFSTLGTLFGVGNGSTTFALPDLRGEFLRGFDDGRGIDLGRGIGTHQNGTQLTFDVVPDTTMAGMVSNASGKSAIGLDDFPEYVSGTYIHSIGAAANTAASVGSLGTTRPRNTALLACIKY